MIYYSKIFYTNIIADDLNFLDEKLDKEFQDPLEHYDRIIREVDSKYEADNPR